MMQRHHTQSEIHLGFFALIRRIITSSLPSSPVLTVELQKMKMEAHEDEMRSLCVTLKPPDLNLFPMRYLFYGLRFTHKLGCGSGRKCCLFQIRLLELMDCSLSFSRLTLFQIKGLLWANIKKDEVEDFGTMVANLLTSNYNLEYICQIISKIMEEKLS
ncbi:uncharacterized protein LOC104879798 isoform X13 [Vitis vinifera]|uniref:uncharacterized protein LOC104879798 isoform X13 n=1 Tax=Vitis vinifera TaxID=29760 RepID=UPI0001BE46DF